MKPAHEVVKSLKGQVRVVFKHFPLDSIHPNARPAAIASLAAHRQGKFWAYHDLLFENAKQLGASELRDWARVAELDMERFERDRKDSVLSKAVQADVLEGQRAGVRGTPSVFLNGRRVLSQDFTSVEGLTKIIKKAALE